MRHQLFRTAGDLCVSHRHIQISQKAATAKTRQVIGPAIEPMAKGATQVGDGCSEDKASVVQCEPVWRLHSSPSQEARRAFRDAHTAADRAILAKLPGPPPSPAGCPRACPLETPGRRA